MQQIHNTPAGLFCDASGKKKYENYLFKIMLDPRKLHIFYFLKISN